MAEEKYCDYCGEIIYLGSRYYLYSGFRICEDCAFKCAWLIFEQEAQELVACGGALIYEDEKDN